MEKAKQTKAPPPAIRSQPSVDLKSSVMQEKPLPPAPPQRAEASRPAQRPQEDLGRSVNSGLQNTAKAPPKRPLQQDSDEHHSRPTIQRNPASYQHNDMHNKRRKTSETFDDDEDMTEPHPKMTAPPIRQSSSRPKVDVSFHLLEYMLISLRKCPRNRCSQAVMPMSHSPAIFRDRPLFLNTT